MLAGDNLVARTPDDHRAAGIDVRMCVEVVAVDTQTREVLLDDGDTVPYDDLVVAAGAPEDTRPVGVELALLDVERGQLDREVVVFDGTEVGLLQVGFNRMATGLREREQLRDLFGRHVGREVAQRAAETAGDVIDGLAFRHPVLHDPRHPGT